MDLQICKLGLCVFVCYSNVEGWLRRCTQRSIGGSWISLTSSRSGTFKEYSQTELLLFCWSLHNQLISYIFFFYICSEEILNPAVPMALRLSGILMGNLIFVLKFFINSLCFSFSTTENQSSLLLRCHFSGGVVIVYERKVKLLYGRLRIL